MKVLINYNTFIIQAAGVVQFDFWEGEEMLLFHKTNLTNSGPIQPPIIWLMAALSSEVKQPRREADCSHPSTAKVKNEQSYTSTPCMPSWHAKGQFRLYIIILIKYVQQLHCSCSRQHIKTQHSVHKGFFWIFA